MLRNIILISAIVFAAGVLFVNVYNSVVDTPNWGRDIPASIQTTRDYFKAKNPGDFFRVFSPLNQILCLLALIFWWKVDPGMRPYCGLALVCAVMGDVFTFAYFYPRNNILFLSEISSHLDAIKKAYQEWNIMNWPRSLIVLGELCLLIGGLLRQLKKA